MVVGAVASQRARPVRVEELADEGVAARSRNATAAVLRDDGWQ